MPRALPEPRRCELLDEARPRSRVEARDDADVLAVSRIVKPERKLSIEKSRVNLLIRTNGLKPFA